MNRPKKAHNSKASKAKGNCLNLVHSDKMVLGTVRQEAGHHKRWPRTLKTKLAEEWLSGSSPLRPDEGFS